MKHNKGFSLKGIIKVLFKGACLDNLPYLKEHQTI